jgi:hypothetical protein
MKTLLAASALSVTALLWIAPSANATPASGLRPAVTGSLPTVQAAVVCRYVIRGGRRVRVCR